jgi:uncharacterized protein (TIRG00374 family)
MNKALAVKIAKVCISAFLIIYILQTADRAELIQTIKSADIYLLIIAFSVNGIGMIPRIYKWQIILAVQEIHVPFKTLLTFSFTSGFFNIFLPTAYGGDIIRIYDVSKFSNKKLESITSILVDRGSGALALFLIAAFALLFGYDLIQDIRIVLFTIGILLLILISIIIIFNEKIKKINIITKIITFVDRKDVLKNMYDTFHIYRYHKRKSIEILALSLLAQLIAILYYPIIAYSFGLDVPLVYFLIVIPIILVILMLPISISGIGVREGAFIFFFKKVGVLPHEAVSIALVAFGLYLIWSLIGGVVYAMRDQKKMRLKN